MKIRAYRLKAGKISDLKIKVEDLGNPGPDEVQIEVAAIGLNFADIFAIWGLYSATPKGEFIPGLEYAGRVIAIGDQVKSFQIGDKVMGIIRFGAYASHLNIDFRYVVPLPEGWTFAQGASYLVQALTAYFALFNLGNLSENKTVLIHSAAGGVGLNANRMAKTKNAFTIGSVGSPHKVDFLRKEGYDRVIVRSKNFADDLKQALGDRKLDLVLECIGGFILKDSFKALGPEGRMIVYGSAQYASKSNRPNYLKLFWNYWKRPKIDPLSLPNRNKSVMGFNLIWLYSEVDRMHTLLEQIQVLNLAPPHIGHRFTFEELPEAIKLFQTGSTIGKVVIEIN